MERSWDISGGTCQQIPLNLYLKKNVNIAIILFKRKYILFNNFLLLLYFYLCFKTFFNLSNFYLSKT